MWLFNAFDGAESRIIIFLAIYTKSPTYRYFNKLEFLGGFQSTQPTAWTGTVNILLFFEEAEPGGRWWAGSPAEQAKRAVMLPLPPPLCFQCTFLCLQYRVHTYKRTIILEHTKPHKEHKEKCTHCAHVHTCKSMHVRMPFNQKKR